MAKERDETPRILEKISPRDKEVILLAAIFFWGKYMRRQINSKNFEFEVPEVDLNDPISVLRAGFKLHDQANRDIGGDAAIAISALILENPKRDELIPRLSDTEVKYICLDLDEMFENQEFCAQCRARSYYDSGPEDFTMVTTTEMLWLCSSGFSRIKHGNNIKMAWFSEIYSEEERGEIVEAVLAENPFGGLHGLLPPASKSED